MYLIIKLNLESFILKNTTKYHMLQELDENCKFLIPLVYIILGP